jgi:putative copper export protein
MAEALPSLLGAALYAALAAMIGALGVHWLVLPRCGLVASERAPVDRRSSGTALLAAALTLLIVPARVALQLSDFLEPGEAWQPALGAILGTQSGKAAQLQMVWATAALLAFSVARAGRARGWVAASIATVVLAMTPGMGGHPATAEQPVVAMTVATMHVLAAGVWIGTLFHIWNATKVGAIATVERMVRAFHRVAFGAVSVLAISGAYAAITTLTAPADLIGTPWGVLLLVKLSLLAIVLAFGAMHWRTAELKYSRGAHASMARSMGTELIIATAVIIVTGFLAATSPPG